MAEDNEGVTALHHAARGGHTNVMNALLVLADNLDVDIVNATNLDGSTPLHWAARKNNELGIRALLKFGAEPEVKNKWGATPLDNAMYAPNGAHHGIALLSRVSSEKMGLPRESILLRRRIAVCALKTLPQTHDCSHHPPMPAMHPRRTSSSSRRR